MTSFDDVIARIDSTNPPARHSRYKNPKSMTRQKTVENSMIAISSLVVGAINGYQHLYLLARLAPGACMIGLIALWVNWGSVQFAINSDQRAIGRPFWPTVILAAQAFIFLSIVSFAIQAPAFLLAGWLHH